MALIRDHLRGYPQGLYYSELWALLPSVLLSWLSVCSNRSLLFFCAAVHVAAQFVARGGSHFSSLCVPLVCCRGIGALDVVLLCVGSATQSVVSAFAWSMVGS